jgi:hypothetical protein
MQMSCTTERLFGPNDATVPLWQSPICYPITEFGAPQCRLKPLLVYNILEIPMMSASTLLAVARSSESYVIFYYFKSSLVAHTRNRKSFDWISVDREYRVLPKWNCASFRLLYKTSASTTMANDVNYEFWCLLKGEKSPFLINAPSTLSIYDLKGIIYQRCTPFHGMIVTDYDLTLMKVRYITIL